MSALDDNLWRIFLGDKSPWFLLEVVFRTVFIFTYTLGLLRWMGKRGMGQLSPFEFAIIVALGSAVGDPMFYDDVPLVHTMIVIAVVIGLQRLLNALTRRSEAIEGFIEGHAQLLIHQGRIQMRELELERLCREELFEMLRSEGVSHLGQVRHAFLEPSGKLSVIRWEPPRPGLSTLPWNEDLPTLGAETSCTHVCCSLCGDCHRHDVGLARCEDPRCPADQPVAAVVSSPAAATPSG